MMVSRPAIGKAGQMKKHKVAPKAASFKQATSIKSTGGTQDREKSSNWAQPDHVMINLCPPPVISMEEVIS